MDLRQTAPPVAEPVTLAEAKAHLRVDGADEDALIALWIAAARETVEGETGRCLLPQDWELRLDAFPCGGGAVALPRAPLAAVLSVTVRDAAGVETALHPAAYQVEAPTGPAAQPGRLVPAAGASWPATERGVAGAVRIGYRLGYPAAGAVPAALRAAMLLLLGDAYANREASLERAMPPNPAVARLLAPYRVWSL